MASPSRRAFFRHSLGAGAFGALSTLSPLNPVIAQNGDPGDYKGLMCVFLNGGNDSNNMVIPLGASYNDYYLDARPRIAIPDTDISALTIGNQNDPAVNPTGEGWGFHPAFSPAGETGLTDLFNQGDLAVLCNVGTLAEPTTRQQMLDNTVALPIQLASHRDQQLQWQAAVADRPFASGWGGRIANNVAGGLSMKISLRNDSKFLVSPNPLSSTLQVSSDQGFNLDAENHSYVMPMIEELYGLSHGDNAQGAIADLFAETHRQKFNTIRENGAMLNQIFNNFSEPANWPTFPNTNLGAQMRRAAILVASQTTLGQNRQIFFCELGGFDTHQNQLGTHLARMTEVNDAMTAFYAATVALGKEQQVTTFTGSDFNRTWTNNRNDSTAGTDHAWGGHSLVMGGAVDGGKFYGRMPILDLDGPDKSPFGGRASWIPTVSVDEFSATLAKWYGLDNTQLADVFPNLGRFSTPDLGFFV